MPGVWYDFIFDNAYQVDAREAEDKMRAKYPNLLHAAETVELAFKDRGGKGRDKEFFTSHRIIIKNGKGVGSKRKNYLSIPYEKIQAYSVQSAGAVLDKDCELFVWGSPWGRISMDFSSENVDIFQIYQFLNAKIAWAKQRGTADYVDPVPPNMDQKQTNAGNMIDWLGNNAEQIDSTQVEEMFKTQYPILIGDEKVQLAFKAGRDTTCFTDKRIVMVNVKGLVGKQIEFLTIPYPSIHGFAVQTAGPLFDRDMELKLFTNMIGELYQIDQDFRHGKADLWAIQKVLCNHILGEDKEALKDTDPRIHSQQNNHGGLFNLIASFNNSPIDVAALDHKLHVDPPVLQRSEQIEMAFIGWRDLTIFTTKRLITIDRKGITGKRAQYFSVPWEKFVAFGVRSAGRILDFDTEVLLYTEMGFYPGEPGEPGDENTPPKPPIPPRPEESCFELDFNKRLVDIFKLKYYLSRRIMEIHKLDRGAPIDMTPLTSGYAESGFERILQWLGNDHREIDPSELDHAFHNDIQILLDDEKCLMAFKTGRDIVLFTNIRVMSIDVQGLLGSRVEYTSLPYRNIHAYSVESAGLWDRDSTLKLQTRNRWQLAKIWLDFRSGKTDIMQIQQLLSAFIVGRADDPKMVFKTKSYEPHEQNPVGWDSVKAALLDNSKEVDANEVNTKLHFDIPVLMEVEQVLRAFSQGRDMYVYTNRRFLIIDTKGLSGQRVKYKTIPYKYMSAFQYETNGHLDRDAEVYCYTDISQILCNGIPRDVRLLRTKQSILVKYTDIYEMGAHLMDYAVVRQKAPDVLEPDIEVIFD